MAIGDKAAQAGLAVYASTQDRRLGWQNDNQRGDELADHMLNGTHPWTKITGKPDLYPATLASIKAALANTGDTSAHFGVVTCGQVVSGLISATGRISTGSDVRAGGDITAQGTAILKGAWSTAMAIGRSAYILGNPGFSEINDPLRGTIGYLSSTQRVKENIVDYTALDIDALLALHVREFDYIDGPHAVGLIAEELAAIPGAQFLIYTDADGQPEGIAYDHLAVALLAALQKVAGDLTAVTTRVDQLTERLDALEKGQANA